VQGFSAVLRKEGLTRGAIINGNTEHRRRDSHHRGWKILRANGGHNRWLWSPLSSKL